jgi:hypothetical protein
MLLKKLVPTMGTSLLVGAILSIAIVVSYAIVDSLY